MSIKILTDSCCDICLEYLDQNKDIIDMIGMPIVIGDRTFIDDLGRTNSLEDFFDELSNGKSASTAQITPNDFYEYFKEQLKNGNQIIYIGLSSGLSGTYNNALMAKNMLEEEGIKESVWVVNAICASVGQAVIVDYATELVKNGNDAKTVVDKIYSKVVPHWFIVDDLNYLKKGGRIPSVLASIGTAFNVKPILTMDKQGKLVNNTNVRGKKKAIKYMVEKLEGVDVRNNKVFLGHANCLEDVELCRQKLLELRPELNIEIVLISATIGCHVGPRMICLSFMIND